jgi:hypothetical protein
MAAMNPPANGVEFTFYACLRDADDNLSFQSTPTIATGDFKVSKDGGALNNLTTLPAVTPAASVMVKFVISATEMTADNVTIVGIDQTTTKEWADFSINILTTT